MKPPTVENNLHPDDLLLFMEVREAMFRVASVYGLSLHSVIPHPDAHYTTSPLGDCSYSGVVRLVMRGRVRGQWDDVPRHPEDVWNTAAHELAHLRHMNHGVAFQEFEQEMRAAMANEQEDHQQKIINKLVKMQSARDGEAAIGNVAAAEAFAAAINRMMIEYELNPSDLDYARATDRDPIIEMTVDLSRYRIEKKQKRIAWQESLARVVANSHLCKFLIRRRSNSITFVGTKAHAMVAEYTYGILVQSAAKMAHQEYCTYWWNAKNTTGSTKVAAGFKGAWLDAFVDRIAERLKENRQQAIVVAPDGGTQALVRLDGALQRAQKYVDEKFNKKRNYLDALSGGNKQHADGRKWGRAAADRMAIGRKALTSTGKTPKLLT